MEKLLQCLYGVVVYLDDLGPCKPLHGKKNQKGEPSAPGRGPQTSPKGRVLSET